MARACQVIYQTYVVPGKAETSGNRFRRAGQGGPASIRSASVPVCKESTRSDLRISCFLGFIFRRNVPFAERTQSSDVRHLMIRCS